MHPGPTATATAHITADVVETLEAAGWTRRWATCTNAVERNGSAVSIHYRPDVDDSVRLELEHVGTNLVELMHVDPDGGAERIARIIIAATEFA